MAQHFEAQNDIEFLIPEEELIAVTKEKLSFWKSLSRYFEHPDRGIDADIRRIVRKLCHKFFIDETGSAADFQNRWFGA